MRRTKTYSLGRLVFTSMAFLALGSMPFSLGSCGDPGQLEPDANAIAVTVEGLSSAAIKLVVTTTLDGNPAKNAAPMEVTGKLTRFGLKLPKEASGTLSITVDAYDAGQCRVSTGTVTTPIGNPWRYEVKVTVKTTGPFCWSNPMPQGNQFRALWAVAQNDVWAVGDAGTIFHYDGSKWATSPSGTNESLSGVWAASAQEVIAVGTKGVALKWDGKKWSQETSGTQQKLVGIWGSGPTAWAVGDAGTIRKRTSGTWSAQTSGVATNLSGVWGRSGTEVYAVGDAGAILKSDGSTWTAMTSGTAENLYGIWGDATSAVAVGSNGTVLGLSGTAWSAQVSGTTETLASVFSPTAGQSWAVGANGALLRGNAGTWTVQTAGTSLGLSAIRGTSGTDLWASGASGQLIRYDGTKWTSNRQGFENNIRSMAVVAPNDIWAVGDRGYLAHYDGTKWSQVTSGATENINSIWAVSATEIYATGDNGTFLRYSGTWSNSLSMPGTIGIHGRAIWATSPTNIWIAATSPNPNEIRLIVQDGTQWKAAGIPDASGRVVTPHGLWGFRQDTTNLLFVSGNRFVMKSTENAGAHNVTIRFTNSDIRSVFGSAANDVWAVGDNGEVYRHDGAFWGPVTTGLSAAPLLGVWRGSPTSPVWVVGGAGTLWKFDGTAWTGLESTTRNQLQSIAGVKGGTDFWVGGLGGTMLRSMPL